METYKLVTPENLNHYGYLIGGNLLNWVDEVAWIAASHDYPGCVLVTIGLEKVNFKKSIQVGSVLKFDIHRGKVGNTSVQYIVSVFCKDITCDTGEPVFSSEITFVRLDENGKKKSLPG